MDSGLALRAPPGMTRGQAMTKIKDLHKAWSKAPAYRAECDALE